MLEILDSLIATVTVVMVLSLIVQSVQQILKQIFNMKSQFLERELFAMFAKVSYERSIVPVKYQYKKLVADHPKEAEFVQSIAGLLQSIGYNDLSLIETMKKTEFKSTLKDLFDIDELKKKLAQKRKEKPEPSGEIEELQEQLDLRSKAGDDVDRWFDTTLKAFQDHYERRMKMWSYGISAIVVIWLNANLFEIYNEFSSNKVLRETAVNLGEQIASKSRDSVIIAHSVGVIDSTIALNDEQAMRRIERQIRKIDSLVNAQSFSMIRWNTPTGTSLEMKNFVGAAASIGNAVWHNLLGWLGMTLLVGLGAPFWYDLLKTLVGIKTRLRGTREQSSDDPNREQGQQQKSS